MEREVIRLKARDHGKANMSHRGKVSRLKKEVKMRENEERDEDCYILDSDPNVSVIADLSKLSISRKRDDHTDISVLAEKGQRGKVSRLKKEVKMRETEERDEECYILAEKGQVACRDYPHSRHLCVNKPFEKTPHASYCELCYCFVCDKVAPCKKWYGVTGHCHAIDDFYWTCRRRNKREKKMNQ